MAATNLIVCYAVLLTVNGCLCYSELRLVQINTQLKITTIEVEPYVTVDRAMYNRTGETRYYGYIPDLLHELSQLINFQYQLSIVPDEKFGHKTKSATKWNGMIGELQNERADVAAGPLYVTEQRRREVDFTVPFMTVHATLLLRRPPPGVAIPVRSLRDLAAQSEIKYGTMSRGIITRAFRRTNDSTLSALWRTMQKSKAALLTATNKEGIERVRRDKYAFILPDVIGEYVSRRKPCDLVTVGRFLMQRGYALALRRHSPYSSTFNHAIERLRETGVLETLRQRWWTGRDECPPSADADEPHHYSRMSSHNGAQRSQLREMLSFTFLLTCSALNRFWSPLCSPVVLSFAFVHLLVYWCCCYHVFVDVSGDGAFFVTQMTKN